MAEYEYFMQFGDPGNKVGKKHFRCFGGGLEEGETAEQAMVREIEEELEFQSKNAKFLGTFESYRAIAETFYEEVGPSFEKEVVIHEGDFGKFFTNEEAQALENLGGGKGGEKEAIQALENKPRENL
ncbi:MAG: NUDIX domain-containing protein [bacterium]|nr:NUDIX domain-containing protein [bacterium]